MQNYRRDNIEAERIKWWQEAKFGMFIHFGLYAIPARGEWIMFKERVPIRDYEKLVPLFKPRPGSARRWARLARGAGMRYMVLTTKHHDGFCLFDSRLTEYNTLHSGARRDLVREYVDACRAEGLRVGLYHSIKDWHHKNYPFPPDFPLVRLEPAARRPDRKKYEAYLLGQLRELLTNYGKIDLLWFDGRDPIIDGASIGREIRKLQPEILINNRLIGYPPDFITPEQMIPNEPPTFNGRPIPWEACHTMTGQSWGYCRHELNADFRTAGQLIGMLQKVVGLGGNFLLNVGPRPDGSLRPEETRRLEEIGRWMRQNGPRLRPTRAGAIRAVKPRSGPAARPLSCDYTVRAAEPAPVNADAAAGAWQNIPAIRISQDTNFDASRERYPGAARHGHCACTLRAMHAGGLLYILAEVESATRAGWQELMSMQNCDAVRFLFAANMDLPRINHTRESFEISLDALGHVWLPNELQMPDLVFRHAVRPTPRGYNAMLALPLEMLRRRTGDPRSGLRPGDAFKFNVCVVQPSPPMAARASAAQRSSRNWWERIPAYYTPYGEQHRVFWKGRAGMELMSDVRAWGVWRLEARKQPRR